MHCDRFGRTPHDIEDEARHSYAEGTVVLRAIADELSKIALKGDTINQWELKHLNDQLYKVYELLGSHTVFGMETSQPPMPSWRPSMPTVTPTVMAHPSRSWWGPQIAGLGADVARYLVTHRTGGDDAA